MNRLVLILLSGLTLAVASYCGFYFWGNAPQRDMMNSPAPELAWLSKEFNLSDAEFKRISQLHSAYRPHCEEMCGRIAAKNAQLKALLAQTNSLTPEIEKTLAEASQLRLECQKAMLRHFMEVSQTMPPQQGQRYLAWVEERTFLQDYGMRMEKR
jgi:hypothetical protein